jgi:hypothetical protein
LGISFIPGLDQFHIIFGSKGGIAYNHDHLSPVRGLKVAEHVTKKLIFFFIIGMAFRQDHLKIYGNAVVIPGHHQHDKFDPEEPGMMLIHAPFLCGRIFLAPFVFFAAVGNNVDHFIFGRW